MLEKTAAPTDDGRQLKYFVRGELGLSYHRFSALKMQGAITVNGKPEHANFCLHEGDVVRVYLMEDERERREVPAENGPVSVVYEDEDILILDKPAPLACQFSEKQTTGTLENRLMHHFGPDFIFRPLNRLDKGTSGLMAAAKNAHATQVLQKQLHTDSFVREYLAVTEGEWSGEGVLDFPICKADAASVRRVVDPASGKPAKTHFRTEKSENGRTLVRLRLETGRTHQIRVHLSHVGHPITGDFLYGTETDELPGRFALHSAYLSLIHPITKERIEVSSPLPDALGALFRKN